MHYWLCLSKSSPSLHSKIGLNNIFYQLTDSEIAAGIIDYQKGELPIDILSKGKITKIVKIVNLSIVNESLLFLYIVLYILYNYDLYILNVLIRT